MATTPSENKTQLAEKQAHASVLLEHLIAEAPPQYFTLEWLVRRLPEYSFGCIFLCLAFLTLVPFISVFTRIFIIILAWQVVWGHDKPNLPPSLMVRPLPSKYLVRLKHQVVPALRWLEVIVRPHWQFMLQFMLQRTRRLLHSSP